MRFKDMLKTAAAAYVAKRVIEGRDDDDDVRREHAGPRVDLETDTATVRTELGEGAELRFRVVTKNDELLMTLRLRYEDTEDGERHALAFVQQDTERDTRLQVLQPEGEPGLLVRLVTRVTEGRQE